MKNYELDVVRYDNEDVIVTSGNEYANHFYVVSEFTNPTPGPDTGNEYSYSGDLWEYYDNAWHKTSFAVGDVGAPDLMYFTDGRPTDLPAWFYCEEEGGYLSPCSDADHSYIHE